MNKLPDENIIKDHIALMFGPGAEVDFSQFEKGEGFSVMIAGEEFGGISVNNGEFETYIMVTEPQTQWQPEETYEKPVLRTSQYFNAMRELAVQALYQKWESICEAA